MTRVPDDSTVRKVIGRDEPYPDVREGLEWEENAAKKTWESDPPDQAFLAAYDRPAAPPASVPVSRAREPEPAEPGMTKAKSIEQGILRDSLADAKAARDQAESAITMFCARRDVPERYKQIVVAIRGLITDIESEQAVFDRALKREAE